ncbi:hypothetical protein [Hydrocoleum sp. CS-953]|nr:hypothetical protein [Hydrocoleum sp. CS-953]
MKSTSLRISNPNLAIASVAKKKVVTPLSTKPSLRKIERTLSA